MIEPKAVYVVMDERAEQPDSTDNWERAVKGEQHRYPDERAERPESTVIAERATDHDCNEYEPTGIPVPTVDAGYRPASRLYGRQLSDL